MAHTLTTSLTTASRWHRTNGGHSLWRCSRARADLRYLKHINVEATPTLDGAGRLCLAFVAKKRIRWGIRANAW